MIDKSYKQRPDSNLIMTTHVRATRFFESEKYRAQLTFDSQSHDPVYMEEQGRRTFSFVCMDAIREQPEFGF